MTRLPAPEEDRVKVKKHLHYDAFVTGFKPGEPGSAWRDLVGALEFSVKTEEGNHVIGYVSSISFEMREQITQHDSDGQLSLVPSMYNRVAEISGQDISGREYRLTHCTLERWRDMPGDTKHPDDCRTSMQDLRKAAAWVA